MLSSCRLKLHGTTYVLASTLPSSLDSGSFLPYIYIYIYVYIHALGWARHLLTAIIRPSIYLLICPMYSDVESILVLPPGRSPLQEVALRRLKRPLSPASFLARKAGLSFLSGIQ